MQSIADTGFSSLLPDGSGAAVRAAGPAPHRPFYMHVSELPSNRQDEANNPMLRGQLTTTKKKIRKQ